MKLTLVRLWWMTIVGLTLVHSIYLIALWHESQDSFFQDTYYFWESLSEALLALAIFLLSVGGLWFIRSKLKWPVPKFPAVLHLVFSGLAWALIFVPSMYLAWRPVNPYNFAAYERVNMISMVGFISLLLGGICFAIWLVAAFQGRSKRPPSSQDISAHF